MSSFKATTSPQPGRAGRDKGKGTTEGSGRNSAKGEREKGTTEGLGRSSVEGEEGGRITERTVLLQRHQDTNATAKILDSDRGKSIRANWDAFCDMRRGMALSTLGHTPFICNSLLSANG